MHKLRLKVAHVLNLIVGMMVRKMTRPIISHLDSERFIDKVVERLDFECLAESIARNLSERSIGEAIDAREIASEIELEVESPEVEIDADMLQDAVRSALSGAELSIRL